MSTDKTLRAISLRPDNKRCFNCDALGCSYVVWPLAIFVCTECSGHHMAIGHRVKSISMGKFLPDELVILEAGGNAVAARQWLATWKPEGDARKPVDKNPRKLDAWVRTVFLDKRYFSNTPQQASAAAPRAGAGADNIPVSPTPSLQSSPSAAGTSPSTSASASAAPAPALGQPHPSAHGPPAAASTSGHAGAPASTQPAPAPVHTGSAFATAAPLAAAAASPPTTVQLGFTDNAFGPFTPAAVAAAPAGATAAAAPARQFDPFGSYVTAPAVSSPPAHGQFPPGSQQLQQLQPTPPTGTSFAAAHGPRASAAASSSGFNDDADWVQVQSVALSEITPSHSAAPSPVPKKAPASRVNDDEEEDELDEEDEPEQHEQQQRGSQGGSSGAGWGVGWGAGWGLGALGGKLREVAAGAVRDVKDLTQTVQAALADVTGAEDEEEEARRLSELDRAAEAAAVGNAGGAAGSGEKGDDDDGQEQAAGSALPTAAPRQAAEPARPQGGSAGGHASAAASAGEAFSVGGRADEGDASGPEDPELETGLQAIDAQVEQLATGAARAISSLWGGLSSVAKVVAAEVAASVADVGLGGGGAVRGVAQIGSTLAHTAERGLETVGRTAMVLLEEVAGVGGPAGRRRIWGEEADARAADMGRDPSTFQDFFYIYGGEQLSEELAGLSNECAHLLNRSRSKLEGDQQTALDGALASLGPLFNDLAVLRPAGFADSTAAAGDVPALPQLEAGSRAAADALLAMYDPIGYLAADSAARAEAFLQQLRDTAAAARRQKQQASSEATAKGEDEEGEEDAVREPADCGALLDSFQSHATKRIAEVTTAQLQLLLNLGASLAAPARTGRPSVDGIQWPDSSEQQAALLAGEARRMLADLTAITAAYLDAVSALRPARAGAEVKPDADAGSGSAKGQDAVATPLPEGLEAATLDELEEKLQSYAASASASIQGGYKGLLYAVLLRRLVLEIAQQEAGNEAQGRNVEEQGEAGKEEGVAMKRSGQEQAEDWAESAEAKADAGTAGDTPAGAKDGDA
ncbi:hypothetical protein GPECTOR_14g37 [Gonium pectorale]|uniref:Arf-GAP domain-containing protein n=1 Tax=Gonium pectorale TaxID=33097 RepID=A0A150GP02_GONPE|nr:hypothetical protein GPECTOR_14g37 [Gonium pectorale]|eukprot:KXZ51050.1 hypothetical protein GPECTOR_14g37 [Gonium pectorale]